MAFWFFMLVCDLIIPCVIIWFGRQFLRYPPERINKTFGYRTTMSMKNQDTWAFAHRLCGKIWFWLGLLLLPLSGLALLPFWRQDIQAMGMAGGLVCLGQLLVMMCSAIPVELALRANFDPSGRRKKTQPASNS